MKNVIIPGASGNIEKNSRRCWIENTGNKKFTMHTLPKEAQFAPVSASV